MDKVKILPLQQALGAIAFFLAFPLFFLRLGLSVETGITSLATIFLLQNDPNLLVAAEVERMRLEFGE